MAAIALLYITLPDSATARSIAHILLEERLIACANIIPAVESLYRWEETIQTSAETVLIAKTQPSLVDSAIACIKALHPYECPAIVSLPVENGYSPFLQWVEAETKR